MEIVSTTEEQLRRLHESGFALETFERYPRHLGAVRDGCIALLEVTPAGLKLTGEPGWRMGETLGVLIDRGGRKVFQAKSEIVEATPERMDLLRHFGEELAQLLMTVV
jgi:hypothetical protein